MDTVWLCSRQVEVAFMSMPAAANHAGLAPSRRLPNVDEASVALIHKHFGSVRCTIETGTLGEKPFGWCLENAIHFTAATIQESRLSQAKPRG